MQGVGAILLLTDLDGDNTDDLTQFIDCIVSPSVDMFAPLSQRKLMKKQRSNYVFRWGIDDAKRLRQQFDWHFCKFKTGSSQRSSQSSNIQGSRSSLDTRSSVSSGEACI